jgi:hypothetical protein
MRVRSGQHPPNFSSRNSWICSHQFHGNSGWTTNRKPKMAQRVQVILVCDMHDDETPGTETVQFALDGNGYEIDLCDDHAAALRDAMATFVGVARRSGRSASGRTGGGARRRNRGSGEAAQIREWARGKGLAVPERGRIPAELAAQYAAAQR